MQINLDDLREHYGTLTDEELLEIERCELTEAAQTCYDEEATRRGLGSPPEHAPEPESGEESETEESEATDSGEAPGWMDDAAIACSYTSHPGSNAASDADRARDVLLQAGIPCQIVVSANDPNSSDGPAFPEFRVMVPGALNLKATSVLDKEVFNPELETEWRSHFEALTDAQLRALTPDVICAGLVDRIARLKRLYNEEVARRANHSSA